MARMRRRGNPRKWIIHFAKKYDIDPQAALIVAMGEGGLRWGAVGDNGTSFGPFQLREGGALPAGKGAQWANSPAGIEYAIRQMAKAGAAGLRGEAAINAIIRKFERPADPDASVRNALARLGQGLQGNIGANVGASMPSVVPGQTPTVDRTQVARQTALQGALSGEGFDPVEFVANLRQAEQAAKQWGGTTIPSVKEQQNGPMLTGGPVDKILAVAHAQIGKPYVWGGESPAEGGFDCSGLIMYAFQQAGIKVPGRLTTYTMAKMGKSVKGKRLRPGDWIITNGGKHVVMFVGGNRVIAAPRRGEVVQYQPLSRFEGDIVDVRRVL